MSTSQLEYMTSIILKFFRYMERFFVLQYVFSYRFKDACA